MTFATCSSEDQIQIEIVGCRDGTFVYRANDAGEEAIYDFFGVSWPYFFTRSVAEDCLELIHFESYVPAD